MSVGVKCRRQSLSVASRKDGSSGRCVDKRAGDVGRGVELGPAEWGAKPEVERIAPGNGGRGYADGERTGNEGDCIVGRGDAGAGDGIGVSGHGAFGRGGSGTSESAVQRGEAVAVGKCGERGGEERIWLTEQSLGADGGDGERCFRNDESAGNKSDFVFGGSQARAEDGVATDRAGRFCRSDAEQRTGERGRAVTLGETGIRDAV